jgi:hypothetical protein
MAKEKIQNVMEECLRRSFNSQKNKYYGDKRSASVMMEGQHQDRASFPPDHRLSKARTPHNCDDFHHEPPRTNKIPRTEPVSEMAQEPGGIQFHSISDSNDINRTDPNQNKSTLNNESTNSPTENISSWSQQLKEVELKFGITSDKNMDYPNRIQEIEKVAGEKAEKKEKFKMPSILQEEEIEAMTKLVEKAEERWGVEAPEHFNLAQRIELVEKTAFNFMARLQVWL